MARRRKIVGPLLPPGGGGGCSAEEDGPGGVEEEGTPGVRRNAEMGSDDVPRERGIGFSSLSEYFFFSLLVELCSLELDEELGCLGGNQRSVFS